MKKILFRLDSGTRMGLGHLMRSKALADAFNSETIQCHFAIQEIHSPNALEPYTVHYLENEQHFLSLLKTGTYQAVIIDHYDYTSEMFSRVKSLAEILVILDDECNRGDLYADVIINSVGLAAQLPYQKYAPQADLLLGLHYVLLRNEFVHGHLMPYTDRKNILITFGGSDMKELTLPVLKKLLNTELMKQPIIVVTGASCPRVEEIDALCRQYSIEHRHNETQMEKLFSQAKMAISAAGSTVFELARCGVPAVFSVIAENQLLSMAEHEQLGWCSKVDCIKHNNVDKIIEQALKMLKNSDLAAMSHQARLLVDANGARNAANAIEMRV